MLDEDAEFLIGVEFVYADVEEPIRVIADEADACGLEGDHHLDGLDPVLVDGVAHVDDIVVVARLEEVRGV